MNTNSKSVVDALLEVAQAAYILTHSPGKDTADTLKVRLAVLDNLPQYCDNPVNGPALARFWLNTRHKSGIDVAMAANVLVHESHSAMLYAGWWTDTETGEDVRTWPKKFRDLWISSKLMLIVTEVGEAMEGHRKGLQDDKLPHRSMLAVELGDAVLRITDLAGGLGIDLGGAIAEKMAYNAQRADHKIENRVAAGGKSI